MPKLFKLILLLSLNLTTLKCQVTISGRMQSIGNTSLMGSYTYYVSPTGSDSNSGTQGSPWLTVAKVNGTTLSAGQSVAFQRGGTWRETLTPGQSGNLNQPITFGAYGNGNKPIISGNNLLTSWTSEIVAPGTDFTTGGTKPISWWYMAETTGSRADSNTTNNETLAVSSGSLTRVTGPNVRVPYAVQFVTATANYLSRTDATLTTGFPGKNGGADADFSVGTWILPTTTPASDADVLGKNNSFVMTTNGTGIRFNVVDDAFGSHNATAASSLTAGVWTHVVATWVQSTGTITVYINGTSSATATAATHRQINTDFQVGWGNPGHAVFNGAVGEVFVFAGTALSGAQVTSIYNYGLSGSPFTSYYSAFAADPVQVLEDNTRLTVATSKITMGVGSFWWDSGNTRIYVRSIEDATPVGHVVEAGARTYVLSLSGKQNITIKSLELRGGNTYGLYATGNVSNLLVDDTLFDYTYTHCYNLNETSATLTNVVVQNSAARYCGASGFESVAYHQSGFIFTNNLSEYNSLVPLLTGNFQFTGGFVSFCKSDTNVDSIGPLYTGNISRFNGFVYVSGSYFMRGVGFWSDTCNGTIIDHNSTQGNRGPAVELEKNSGSRVSYHISNGDNLHGILYGSTTNGFGAIYIRAGETLNSSNILVANNTIYNAGYAGISVISATVPTDLSNVSTTTVENNIVIGATFANLFAGLGGNNDTIHGIGNIYRNNAFGVASATLAYWTGTGSISTYAGLDTAYGLAMGNIETDPLLNDPAAGDFMIPTNSPAYQTGIFIFNVSTSSTPNIGAADSLPAPPGAISKGPNQINLTWSAQPNPGYGYIVEVKSAGDSRYTNWTIYQPIPTASGYTCDPSAVWQGVTGCNVSDAGGAYIWNPPVKGVPTWVVESQYIDPQDGTAAQFIVAGLKNNTSYSFRIRTYTGNTSTTYGTYSTVAIATTSNYVVRYISTTGNDSNDGTAIDDAHAWSSLNKSSGVACGTVVYVKGGSYTDWFGLAQSCTQNSKVVLQANPGDTAILATNLHPPFGGALSIYGDSIVVDGLTLAENNQDGYITTIQGNHDAMFNMTIGPTIVPTAVQGVNIKGSYNLLYGSYIHDFGSPYGPQNPSGNGGESIQVESVNSVVWSNHITRGAHDNLFCHQACTGLKALNNVMDGGWGMAFEVVYNNANSNSLFEGNIGRYMGNLEEGIYKPAFELSYIGNTVRRNIFTDIGNAFASQGIEITGGYPDSAANNLVYNNVIYNVGMGYFQSTNGGVAAYDGVIVRNNIIKYTSTATSIYLANTTAGAISYNHFRLIGGTGTEALAKWSQLTDDVFHTLTYLEVNNPTVWIGNAALSVLTENFVSPSNMDFHLATSNLKTVGVAVTDTLWGFPFKLTAIDLGAYGLSVQ